MKNLETVYRNQISLEIPDLWSRIEAGVDSYEASKYEEITVVDKTSENIVSISKKKKFNIVKFVPVISAAACFLLILAVYAVTGSGTKTVSTSEKSKSSKKNDFAATAEYSYSEEAACEEAVASDEAPAYEESAGEMNSSSKSDDAMNEMATTSDKVQAAERSEEYNDIYDAFVIENPVAEVADTLGISENWATDVLDICENAGINTSAITMTKMLVNNNGTALVLLSEGEKYLIYVDISADECIVTKITKDGPDGEVIY